MNAQDTTDAAIRQWRAFKSKHADCLLLFRIGDFYEAFGDDAVTMGKSLGLTVTSARGLELAGVPYHSLEVYLKKLIALGIKVAVADVAKD